MFRMRSWRDLVNIPGVKISLRGGLRYLFGKRGQRLVRSLRVYYRLRINILIRTGEPIARLTRRSDVRLFVDGKDSFRRIERWIRRARHHIVVQMFIWRNDETGTKIAELLLEAADRGVNVDITKEAVGDFFEFRGDFIGTKGSPEHPWNRFWNHPRIHISYATNSDHAKVFAIDGYMLLLTGMNVADEYRNQWHDYLVELRGTRFVTEFLTREKPLHEAKNLQLVMNTEDKKDIRAVTMSLLEHAHESIIVEHCYLADESVTKALIDASRRGVRVTLILPGALDFYHHGNMLTVGRLLAEGKPANVRVFLYPGMSHAKALLVDHQTAFIGSANLYTESLDVMGEVNVLITSKRRVLWKLQESLRGNILRSKPITSPPSFLWISKWLAWLGL